MPSMSNIFDAGDVLIVGGGIAGLALARAIGGRKPTLLAVNTNPTASHWAQGGIAASLGDGDSPKSHAEDTIRVGAGLVIPKIAYMLANAAPAKIKDLSTIGITFDKTKNGRHALGREAGHSNTRIVHVSGDQTGHAIMSALTNTLAEQKTTRYIHAHAYELAVENGSVIGVFVRNTHDQQAPHFLIRARATVLATGGAGHLYATTTNPQTANAEAMAMAARAGADIVDAEFVQFHPTAFAGLGDPSPLATEALRGTGAWLVNADGNRFMPSIHSNAELAPRDIVARAVEDQIARTGKVGLDLRPVPRLIETLNERFPTVFATCKRAHIDLTRMPIPVVPAAHYHMGGIATDTRGRSSLRGLWVCGEAAATGAHGANRLASNSLLEALVFAERIAEDIDSDLSTAPQRTRTVLPMLERKPDGIKNDVAQVISLPNALRQMMTRHVGLRREAEGLRTALAYLRQIEQATPHATTLHNMATSSLLITAAALKREESRGSHMRTDFPNSALPATRCKITLEEARTFADTQGSADTAKLMIREQ